MNRLSSSVGLAELTRVAAIVIGSYGTFFAASADKGVVLAFAGGLLIAPDVVSGQRKRNRDRP